MRKIGLFGGTFDPIHNGHLIIAEYLRDELALQEIWFVPAKVHPLKSNKEIAPSEHRKKMLELAISDNSKFQVCEVEINRQGISYTKDTIDILLKQHADISPEFYFFVGMDNVNDLHRWKEPGQILKKCKVVAFGRPGFKPDESAKPYLPYIQFVHVPLLEISSTFVRNRIKQGQTVRYIIPARVDNYIRKNRLYV